ncbi:kinesin-like protein KIF12 [Actinia tenebrosa]|uniref:Kinesin-like protein n=1 Tax=Actinia tenebrosa TaxID=6105 RepID=A0A6P8HY15_ACTTE|nr:kinesin-like protein KIF12 [Actinia tenebrosa]
MEDDTRSENPQTSPNKADVKNDTDEEEQKNTDELGDSDSPNTDSPPLQSSPSDASKSSRPSSLHSSRSATESDLDSNPTSTSAVDSIKVVIRVRPLNPSENARKDKNIVSYPGDGAIWIDNNFGQVKPFTFNAVFDGATSQAEMFEQCGIKNLINMALEGYSCTAFAFGQTGSGKTYTITGPLNTDGTSYQDEVLPSPEMLGLLERSFQYLFDAMDKKADLVNYTLRASYLEVYNERVKDLLNPSSAHDSLPVRWARDRGFYVENLFYVECDALDDLTAVLEEGLKYRQVGSHNMNDHSSRSHSMLTVYIDIEMVDPNDESGFPVLRHGKISFVDLAGSERVKETKSHGESFAESQNINKSLLTLGNCISALSDAKKRSGHIPYRDSKLTKLLADSLGGNGVTLMIACISPSSYLISDTLNTLRYAHRAKKIKNKPVVQMDPKEKLIISLKREIKLLRTENNYFRQQLGLPSSDSQTTVTSDTDQNGNKIDNNNSSSKQPSIKKKTNSLLVKDDERNKLTTANLTAGANSGLYDMLQEYMIENEHLRSENGDLHKSRDEISRQRAIVSRENERLLKKLEDLERVFVSSPVSFRSLSGVERSRSLPEGGKSTFDYKAVGYDVGYRSSSNPDYYQLKHRSSSEPTNLSFPPINDGPYPNYVHHGSLGSVSDDSSNQADRKPMSKSSPAKLRKQPLTPEKFQGGYAQIFAKHRGKKIKEKQSNKGATQSTSKPIKAFTTHGQLNTTTSNTSYSQNSYKQNNSSSYPYDTSSYSRQLYGYNGQHIQRNVPERSYQPQSQYSKAFSSTQPSYQLQQDLGNIDSQIQYYSYMNKGTSFDRSPNR